MSDHFLTEIEVFAEILMAAAYADGAFQPEEDALIRRILAGAVGGGPLPPSVETRLERFEPDTFEMVPACEKLQLDGAHQRRQLLALVARVTEVDNINDVEESHLIRRLARCIGAKPAEYKDLVFDLTAGDEDRTFPPPLPRRRRGD